jgi:hypothetical protein
MFQQLAVAVESIGENVRLRVGTSIFDFQYEVALQLSERMQGAAREARRFDGVAAQFRVSGTLHDAERPNAGQPLTPGKSPNIRVDDLLRAGNIDAVARGAVVVLTLRATSMDIPYAAAAQIAQWIRLRAKESKLRAGDSARHWSSITSAVQH